MRSSDIAIKIFRELIAMERNKDTSVSVRSYSGRAMYGRDCVGLVGDFLQDIFGSLGEAAKSVSEAEDFRPSEVLDVLSDLLGDIRMDSMGLGMVVYFPSVSADFLKENEENTDDSEDDE